MSSACSHANAQNQATLGFTMILGSYGLICLTTNPQSQQVDVSTETDLLGLWAFDKSSACRSGCHVQQKAAMCEATDKKKDMSSGSPKSRKIQKVRGSRAVALMDNFPGNISARRPQPQPRVEPIRSLGSQPKRRQVPATTLNCRARIFKTALHLK